MCDQKCSYTEECRYDKENCEYKCVFSDEEMGFDRIMCDGKEGEYFYSYTKKLTAGSGLSAFIAAINFLF